MVAQMNAIPPRRLRALIDLAATRNVRVRLDPDGAVTIEPLPKTQDDGDPFALVELKR